MQHGIEDVGKAIRIDIDCHISIDAWCQWAKANYWPRRAIRVRMNHNPAWAIDNGTGNNNLTIDNILINDKDGWRVLGKSTWRHDKDKHKCKNNAQ